MWPCSCQLACGWYVPTCETGRPHLCDIHRSLFFAGVADQGGKTLLLYKCSWVPLRAARACFSFEKAMQHPTIARCVRPGLKSSRRAFYTKELESSVQLALLCTLMTVRFALQQSYYHLCVNSFVLQSMLD